MTTPLLSQRDSQRLEALKFPLVCLVIMIHAYEPVVGLAGERVGYAGGELSNGVRFAVSQGLARVAVPLFFLMAGFFFFLGWDGRLPGLLRRWRSRVGSLLVPFLFWNLLAIALLLLVQEVPLFAPLVTGQRGRVLDYGVYELLDALVGLSGRPAAYPFWFVRDLMVLVLLAPLLRALLRRPGVGEALLLLAALAWLFRLWPVQVPAIEALLFFAVGGFAATRGFSLFTFDRAAGPLAVFCLATLAVLMALPWQAYSLPLWRLAIAGGVVCALGATALLWRHPRLLVGLLRLAPMSFFLFAFHEPLLTVLRKLSYLVVRPQSEAAVLLLYVAVPACTVLTAWVVHQGLLHTSPRLLAWISGGRVASPATPPTTPRTRHAPELH